jgi:RNA polymerase sigma-70 factor, ECF subfamily
MLYSSLSAEELVRLCAETGENEAWQEFVRRFHIVIASSVRRIAVRWGETSSAVIDDLIQETYLKVCANDFRLLRRFQAQHADAFHAVLRVTAANAARDYFRAKWSNKRGSGAREQELTEVEQFVPDGHSTGPAKIEREILIGEIDAILSRLCSTSQARDREIFWLYYRQGLTAEAIAGIAVFNLTTKGVESILHRLKKQVRAAMVEREEEKSGAKNLREITRAEPKGSGPLNAFMKGEGQP